MKARSFDRELARAVYLKSFPFLKKDKRKLELLLLRSELLSRNPLFTQDWEAWKKSHAKKTKPYWDGETGAFFYRWKVDPWSGLTPAFDPVAYAVNADRREAILLVNIDLRQSKRKIIGAVETLVDQYQELLRDDIASALSRRGTMPSWWGPEFSSEEIRVIPKANESKTHTDPEDYRKALSVWDLREVQKKTWSEIQTELKLNNLQAGRNWHRLACELIKDGIPTLAPFPKK